MQKILSVKTENSRNAIPLMGKHLCLVEVTGFSMPEGGETLAVYPFKDENGDGASLPSTLYSFGYYYDNEEEIHLFQDLDSFGALFDMTKTDRDILADHIINTAHQLKLSIVPMDGGLVIVNEIVNQMAKQGCSVEELEKLKNQNRDVALGVSGAGAATLLGEIVKTGMGRFNKVNLDDKVQDIINIIKACRFIDDNGNCRPITFTGVESLVKRVKDGLFVSTND